MDPFFVSTNSTVSRTDPIYVNFGLPEAEQARLQADVDMVASHPLIKGYAEVGGFMYDVDTGRLTQVI